MTANDITTLSLSDFNALKLRVREALKQAQISRIVPIVDGYTIRAINAETERRRALTGNTRKSRYSSNTYGVHQALSRWAGDSIVNHRIEGDRR